MDTRNDSNYIALSPNQNKEKHIRDTNFIDRCYMSTFIKEYCNMNEFHIKDKTARINHPPTLRELLSHRKATDKNNIDVSQHNYKKPEKPKTIYVGPIDDVPEKILNLEIIAWSKKDGIYISK